MERHKWLYGYINKLTVHFIKFTAVIRLNLLLLNFLNNNALNVS